MALVDDPVRVAREGASYAVRRQQMTGSPVAVVFDGGRVCCLDAGSARARRYMQEAPARVAGVYGNGADRESIVEDLLIVLSA